MDTSKAVTHLGLCAGYGGIELGLKRAIPNLRTIALCEIEAFAISNLVAKMEAGFMDPAPIWPDLKTFPWAAFRDRVDILTGGYPCQPFSAAGQRKGKQDPRHLWPWIADGIRLLRPRICFFENVEGHISLGLSDVIEDLAGMGYRTTWGIFSASECGAPHQRKRVFIMANRIGSRLEGFTWNGDDSNQPGRVGQEQNGSACASGLCCWPSRPGEQQYGWEPPRVVSGLENTTGQRSWCESGDALHQGWTASEAGTESVPQDTGWSDGAAIADDQPTGGDGEELGDTGCERQEERQVEAGGSEQSDSRQTQPPLGGDADGASSGLDYAELCVSCDNRTDELRLLGNGVVPATAERAFRTLIKELL
jgi:DNA (cytosine-5)-methyltransferase 1